MAQTDLQLILPSSDGDSASGLKYTWRAVSMTSKILSLEIKFEKPLNASQGNVKDKMILVFNNPEVFKD